MAYSQFLPNYGGIEKHIYSVSRELRKRGHQVTVLTTNLVNNRPRKMPHAEIVNDMNIVRLRALMLKYPISPEAVFRSLPKYDILHIHSLNPNFFMLPLQVRRSLKGLPIAITPHFHPDRLRFDHWLVRRYLTSVGIKLLKCADAVIALTSGEKKYYEKHGIEKIFEIPNGVDLESHSINRERLIDFNEIHDPDKRKILFVGRMVKNKGLQTLLQGLPQILKVHQDVILYAVGAYNEYAHRLQLLAKKLKCEEHVRFFFDVTEEDLPYYYEASDLVAIPSSYEAFSLVILESWAHKKPVLVSNRGAMVDLVSRGGGLVINSLSSKEWALAIADLLSDESKLRKLGNEGHNFVIEKYTWKHVAEKIEKAYFDVLS